MAGKRGNNAVGKSDPVQESVALCLRSGAIDVVRNYLQKATDDKNCLVKSYVFEAKAVLDILTQVIHGIPPRVSSRKRHASIKS